MLQQILKDMYIDPDVLEALNEDQKKTLFLKMRQEQVRRWTEREEKVPAEGRSSEGLVAKPANRKSVTWLLGRDGDVAVMVIGDSDEPRSARLIGTSLEDKPSPYQQKATLKSNVVNKTTTAESGRAVREDPPPKPQTGIHLNLKGNAEEVSCSPPLQVSAGDKPPPRAADDPPASTQASGAAAPEESKPPVTFYRPHIRVAPASQRQVNVSSPPRASVTTPASTPASVSTPSLSSSAAAAAAAVAAPAPAQTSSSSLASAPAPSPPLPVSSTPALALARCSAPALALARASTPASTSASTPASTPAPAPTPSLALSPSSAPTSSSTASKTPSPPSSRLHPQEPRSPPRRSPKQTEASVISGPHLSSKLHTPVTQFASQTEREADGARGGGGSGGWKSQISASQWTAQVTAGGDAYRSGEGTKSGSASSPPAGETDIRVVAASRPLLPEEEEAGPEGVRGGVKAGSRRGRVAQLMKTFSVDPPALAPPALAPPPRGSKPPLPSKPSHLRLTASPSLR